MAYDVSIIITAWNGEQFVDQCMQGIIDQTALHIGITVEIVLFLDGRDSEIPTIVLLLDKWKRLFNSVNVPLVVIPNDGGTKRGVGYGRNRAIKSSRGTFLCFQDIDDIMYPKRIELQYAMATNNHNAIIGCRFDRNDRATLRYTEWANYLPHSKLNIQVYTSHGPTVIMPTWFCHRSVMDQGFDETPQETPEDLIAFYNHLNSNGKVLRVDEPLLLYRYHKGATTFTIREETIFGYRLERLIQKVLSAEPWISGFTIWNAGKGGKKFYRQLPPEVQQRVKFFCDVDVNKIGKSFQPFDPSNRKTLVRSIPILSYKTAPSPFIICVKLDLTGGDFESNLASRNLIEGVDYVLFS